MAAEDPKAAASAASRPRRWRWTMRIAALSALLLPVFLIGALLLLVATDAGLEVLRQVGVGLANPALEGRLSIGTIRGSLLSEVTVSDFVLEDGDQREAVALDRLRLAWDPWALLSGRISVERVELLRPAINMVETGTQGLNLARLARPSDTSPADPPDEGESGLSLPSAKLHALRVIDGRIRYQKDDAEVARVEALDMTLSAEAKGEDLNIRLSRLTAAVQDDLPLSFSATAELKGDRLAVRGLEFKLAEATAAIPEAEVDMTQFFPSGQAKVQAFLPSQLLRSLGGPKELLADLRLVMAVQELPTGWTGRMHGYLGTAPVAFSATVSRSLEHVEASLQMDRLNPAALWYGLPQAELDLELDAEGEPLLPRVGANLRVQGWFQPPGRGPVRVDALTAQVSLQDSRLRAKAQSRLAGARVVASAEVKDILADTPVVSRARAEAEVPSLGTVLGRDFGGRVSLSATASGPVDRLSTRGHLQARRVRAPGGISTRSVVGKWDLTGLPQLPVGSLRLEALETQVAGRRIRSANLRAEAKSEAGTLVVGVPDLSVRLGSLLWSGKVASFSRSPDGAMTLLGLSLSSAAGRLEAEAKSGPGDPSFANLEAKATWAKLDLGAALRPLVGGLEQLSGIAQGQLSLRRKNGRTRGDIDLDLVGFSLHGQGPKVRTGVFAQLQPGRLTARAEATGLAEALKIRAQLPAPTDALNPDGWKAALRSYPVESASLDIEALDLARLQSFLGRRPELTGRASLSARLEAGGRQASAVLTAAQLRGSGRLDRAEGGGRIRLRFRRARATLNGRLVGVPFGSGTLSATIAGPSRVLDVAGWQRLGPRAVRGARLDLDRLRLSGLSDLGLVESLAGQLDLHIAATSGLRSVSATVAAESVKTPWVRGTWSTNLYADVAPYRAKADLRAEQDGVPVLSAVGQAPLRWSDLLEGRGLSVDALPVTATVTAQGLELSDLLTGVSERELARGRLFLNAAVSGPPQDLQGRATTYIEKPVIGGEPFSRVEAEAEVHGRLFEGRVEVTAPSGRGLRLTATGTAAKSGVRARGKATADGLPLRFLSRLGDLPLSFDGDLFADVDLDLKPDEPRPEVKGWLEARGKRVVFSQAALQPMRNARTRVDLEPEAIRLAFDAQSLRGTIGATVDVDLASDEAIRLMAEAQLARFPIRAGQLAEVDLKVKSQGVIEPKSGVKLRVDLNRGLVVVSEEPQRALHPIAPPGEVEFVRSIDTAPTVSSNTSTPAEAFPVEVLIKSVAPIDVRSENKGPVDMRLQVDLASRTTGQSGLRGRVWISDGTIELIGREYRVDRAEIVFEGKSPPDPRINIRLSHEFSAPSLDFVVSVTGPSSAPRVDFSSSPSRFSQTELLQVFQGTDPSELGRDDGRSDEDRAVGAAAGFIANQVANDIARALPVIDTLKLNASEEGVVGVTLGFWITRQVFIAAQYQTNPSPSENDVEGVVEYRFLPGWIAELVAGAATSNLDVLWTHRF